MARRERGSARSHRTASRAAITVVSTAALQLAAGGQAAHARPVTMVDVVSHADPVISDLSVSALGVLGAVKTVGRAPELRLWSEHGERAVAAGGVGAISPDGAWLLVLEGSDWVLRNLASGAETRLHVEGRVSAPTGAPVWSPDSRFVAAHYDTPTSLLTAPAAQIRDGVPVETFEVSPATDHARLAAYRNPHLLIWDVTRPNPSVQAFSETESYAGSWLITPEGRHAYAYVTAQLAYGGQIPYTAVRMLTVEDGDRRELYRAQNFNQGAHPRISPDGRTVAVAVDLDTPKFGVANSLVLLDLRSGRARRLTQGAAFSDVQWGPDGALYATRRDGGLQSLDRVTLDGRVVTLASGRWNRRGLAASLGHDRLVYTGEDGYGRKAILTWTPASGERVTKTVSDPAALYDLGAFEQVAWRTPDGLRLKGFLIKPQGFSPRRRYPLLVDVHGGGPNTPLLLFSLFGWLSQTPLEWHAWAALGYVVFVPDYRSSGEYGAIINKRREAVVVGDDTGIEADARDVLSGVRWLAGQGFIDPRRIAIFGQSAGGGRINYLLTQTHLFAAGILHDPIASGSVAELLRAASLHLPAPQDLGRLSRRGREAALGGFLFDGWRSTTPTLIMTGDAQHGALDPLSAETLFSLLAASHTPVEMLRFPNDGHEPTTPGGALARYHAMKQWLDRFAPADAAGASAL